MRIIPAAALGLLLAGASYAQQPQTEPATPVPPGARHVPDHVVPVPDTVRPQMQAIIAQPYNPNWNVVPKTPAEWKAIVDKAAAAVVATLPEIRERLGVSVQPTTIDGVRAFIVTPKTIAPHNRERVLVHVHGGAYVLSPGEAATKEAIELAGFGGFKVISVDYRMPPDFPYPAAMDDAMAVYRAVLKTTKAKNVGLLA
jgi:monoterpene epsilon-lactone hydrolase